MLHSARLSVNKKPHNDLHVPYCGTLCGERLSGMDAV